MLNINATPSILTNPKDKKVLIDGWPNGNWIKKTKLKRKIELPTFFLVFERIRSLRKKIF